MNAAFLLMWIGAAPAVAQVPDLTLGGTATEPLIGEEVCTTVDFANVDAPTSVGFGPYVFVTMPPGVTVTTNTYLGIAPPVQFVGVIDASGMIADPISGTVVSGEPGGNAYIVRYPVGSLSGGQPPLQIDLCGHVEPGAEIGVPLEINMLPGFEFGDTPTGDNGPITGGSATTATITPQLARVTKIADVPEGERPPGPSNTFAYTYQVNVSEGVTLDMPSLTDVLPDPEIQWTGAPISVTAASGVLCGVITEPNVPNTPGGTLVAGCQSLTGTASENDLVVSIPVYITDILDESNNNDTQLITNTVDLDYSYQGTDYNQSDTAEVRTRHVVVQKSVSPQVVVPGDTVNYALHAQVTDYDESVLAGSIAPLVLTDILGNGLTYTGNATFTLNTDTFPITPAISAGPGAGETQLLFDIATGEVASVPLGSRVQVNFQAEVAQSYANGDNVAAADHLTNTVDVTYAHSDSSGADGTDGSAAGVDVEPNQAVKSLVAPMPLPDPLAPGDVVTFRLEMDIPSEDTLAISLTDYLPLPVVVVGDIDPNTDIVVPNIPGVPAIDPIYTANAGTNSFTLTWPDPAGQGASRVAADVTVTISSEPFADGLFLTNLLIGTYLNTDGITQTTDTARGFNVGAPDVFITKGVLSVDNPAATVSPAAPADPAQALVDSNAFDVDAGDLVEFVLTVENRGSQAAWNVEITDPAVAGLNCQALNAADVTDGTGAQVAFNGNNLAAGIVVPGPLPGNDGNPVGGGAPFGADTLLVRQRCTVAPTVVFGETLTNTASLSFTSTQQANDTFPERSDEATVSIASPTVDKTIVAVTPGYANDPRQVQIGEVVEYQVVITVPEGTAPDASFLDILDPGMAFLALDSIVASPGLGTTVPGGFPAVVGNAGIAPEGTGVNNFDRRLYIGPGPDDFGFGTVTNGDTTNGTAETLTLRYRALVLNYTGNTRGHNRNNLASWSWALDGQRPAATDSALTVRIIEPTIEVTKAFTPDTVDQSNPATVQIRVRHSAASDGTAFELNLVDALPTGVTPDLNTLGTTNCNVAPDVLTASVVQLNASWEVFPLGADCTIVFATTGQPPLPAGFQVQNCAQAVWTSMHDVDLPVPQPPSNALGAERTGNTNDIGGDANTYRDEGCAILKIFDVGITKLVVASDQAHTGINNGVEELAIGEQVTFLLTAKLPENFATNLVIEDSLPTSGLLLEAVSAEVLPLPQSSNLQVAGGLPVPVLEDRALGDGLDDTVVVTFNGVVTNLDPNDTTTLNNSIEVLVTAVLRDLPINQQGAEDDNVGRVTFGQNLEGTDLQRVRALEPLLDISKTSDTTAAEAGDSVHFVLNVSHTGASGTDAFDLVLDDALPAGLLLQPGTVAVGSNCTVAPDTGPAAAGNAVTAAWTAFPLGATCDIEFDALVQVGVVSGSTVTNTAEIAWTTLDDTVPAQTEERSYADASSWDIVISDPGIAKTLQATDIDLTVGQQVTIGETMTFEMIAEFPDGTTDDVTVGDVLPFSAVDIELVSSRIVSIGADLSLSSGAAVGDPGDDCVDCSQGNKGFDDTALWNLGTVVNLPNPGSTGPGPRDQVVFEVVGIVLDAAANQGIPVGQDFVYNTTALLSANFSSSDQASFTLIEPRLLLRHFIEPGDRKAAFVTPGDIMDIRLKIAHAGNSSAPAFNVTLDDVLGTDVLWVNDGTVSSDCPGLVTLSPGDGVNGTAQFSFDVLTLDQGACSISFQVQIDPLFASTGAAIDRSSLGWESAPGSAESRMGTDGDQVAYVAFANGALSKRLVSTSVQLTGNDQGDPSLPDITIGETLTYELVAALSQGTSLSVAIEDTLPAGLEVLGANVVSIGNGMTTTETGAPVINGNQVRFEFGDVSNGSPAGVDDDDTIVVAITARVIDVGGPAGGDDLQNAGVLEFNQQTRNAVAMVDIVEPELQLDKQFGDVVDARVPITLTVTNSGTAPAFSTLVSDNFDETLWVAGSLQPVFVPDGWSVSEASAGGVTTVTFGPTGDPDVPALNQVIEVGASRTVTFSMELVTPYTLATVPNLADATALSLRAQDPAAREATADAAADLPLPLLDSEKVASIAPAEPGDVITYTVTITNNGNADAHNLVVTDAPDSAGEFQVGSVTSAAGVVVVGNNGGDNTIEVTFADVTAGQSVSFSYDVRVPYPYPAAGPDQFVNQAIIASDEVPDFASDDPATAAIDDPTIVPIIADPIPVIDKEGVSDVIAAGGTIYYRLVYANIGNQDDTGVVITDSVPEHTTYREAGSTPGWSCADGAPANTVCSFDVGNLRAGFGGVIFFAVTVDDPLTTGVTVIENTATITDAEGNTDSDMDDDDTLVVAAPVLEITKDDGGITTSAGGTVTYLLDYVNTGRENATGVRLLDTVPANTVFDAAASLPDVWSCPDGSGPGTACVLQVGDLQGAGLGTGQARFGVRVDSPLPAGVDQINNEVFIADDGAATLGVPIVAVAFDNTPVVAAPDLVITKSDNAIVGFPGATIPYTLDYFQVGDQDATGVIISETVPVGTTYSAAGSAPYNWSCADGSPAGTACTLGIGPMTVGSGGTAVFAVQVNDPLPAGQSEVYNVVVIADDGTNGPDPTPANNTDDESTLVTLFRPAGRKSVTQTSDHQVTWRMVWFNNQNTLDLPVQVFDPIPAPAQYIGGSVVCDATGTSQCLTATYNAAENRVEVEAIIAPDFGAPDNADESQLNNEIVITFVTTVAQTQNLTNVADACWDENNSGTADDDRAMGQVCIPVQASIRAVIAIPVMGPLGAALMAALLGLLGAGALNLRRAQLRTCRPSSGRAGRA